MSFGTRWLNKEVEEGLHITSMAGTWMSIVEGFGGMRIKNDQLSFDPQIPEQWSSYAFKVNFRGQIVTIKVEHNASSFEITGDGELDILVNGKSITLIPGKIVQA